MQRRTLIQMAALSGLLSARPAFLRAVEEQVFSAARPVKKVLLVTKCHLDVGFSMTQAQVIREYFDRHYPQAIKTATALRNSGTDRYVWTTGSWLLYEYLEQASSSQRRAMDDAVAAGDITWHALPFTWQTEMINRSMIDGALAFSGTLDRRFGHRTISGKMTDVPGHSRGIVQPLAAHGVRLLDIGINPASTPPDVPNLFLWKEPGGQTLAVLYHRQDYGSIVEIPGTDVAVDVEVRGDNSGPHTLAEISEIYAKLRARFPGAEIQAASLNEVAAAVEPVRNHLPVVSTEIGDTWIYGCASDPAKIARYREVARLRQKWIEEGRLTSGDIADRNLLQYLLLAVEHTWGTDTKKYLDYRHYRPADLASVLATAEYQITASSWKEKQDDIDTAVTTLPPALRREAQAGLGTLSVEPSHDGMVSHDPTQPFLTRHFALLLDSKTGALIGLQNRTSGRQWAASDNPLGLLTYRRFLPMTIPCFSSASSWESLHGRRWTSANPRSPSVAAKSRQLHPRLTHCWTARGAAEDRLCWSWNSRTLRRRRRKFAWPRRVFVSARMPGAQPQIDIEVLTFDKSVNRLPEAIWWTIAPAYVRSSDWMLTKLINRCRRSMLSRWGRAMHAVSQQVICRDPAGNLFRVETLDAPVVAVGKRSPLNFSTQLPSLDRGIHFNLYNNAWGTNYPQWCGGNWRYRFRIFA